MYTRLNDIPVYESRCAQVNAMHFNHVQIALKKLGESIRLPIPKLKHLDLIVEKEAWIIVDRVLNDIPIAAWTDFQSEHRSNLHEPIACRLQLYHANADLILERTLEAMEMLLGEQLADALPDTKEDTSKVLPFPKK
ncbi:MAG: hypothetical protein AMJ53_08670 [Gammaproteobacteria bacterium SG8_11]|nr:MAG: hypothetical protein AMJ53_08670 [Gammaproteobacteria bacterium SG8_11]